MRVRVLVFSIAGFFLLLAHVSLFAKSELSVLYLSWQHDPTSTMMIHWHTADQREACVQYRRSGDLVWNMQEGICVKLPETHVRVNTVELYDLHADTEYEFCVLGFKEDTFRFRTLPASLSRPVRFVIGGDAYLYRGIFRKMNQQIATQNPDFVVIGGDIAYTCGVSKWMSRKPSAMKRWHIFLKEWKDTMVIDGQRLIPILPVLGNHDVRSISLQRFAPEVLFYELFCFPIHGIAFRVLDMGDYMSLFLLDSGHSCHIAGMQTQWLKKRLAERENKPYKIAAYHVAGYPSVYSYNKGIPVDIRTFWSILFERYHLHTAFEHHNHAYKRTFPMKGGKIDPEGIVYVGDGSWGIHARETKENWYLAQVEKANAVCVVTLSQNEGSIKTLRIDGEYIDSMKLVPSHSDTHFAERKLLRD